MNDVSGKLFDVAGGLGVGYVGTHSHTVPVLADNFPIYDDLCRDVASLLSATGECAVAAGAGPVWVDPGIGFGKSAADNLKLLRHLPALCHGPFPVLLGASRKSFLGNVTGRHVDDRLAASLAIVASAWSGGVDVIRVHDMRETVDVIATLAAVRG